MATDDLDLDALRGPRDDRGRFVKGAPGPRLETGERSALVLKVGPLAQLHAELVETVTGERGGDRLSTVHRALIEEWAAVKLLAASQRYKAFNSTKERSRQRALDRYQSLLDRLMRLSAQVGMERAERDVPSIDDYMRGARRP